MAQNVAAPQPLPMAPPPGHPTGHQGPPSHHQQPGMPPPNPQGQQFHQGIPLQQHHQGPPPPHHHQQHSQDPSNPPGPVSYLLL